MSAGLGRAPGTLVLLGGLLLCGPSLADEIPGEEFEVESEDQRRQEEQEQRRQEEEEERAQYGVQARTAKWLNAAVEALGEDDYETAREKLNKLRWKRLNPYEQAITYRMHAYVEFATENLEGAIEYFQKAIDEEALPYDDEASLRFNIAQLYTALEQWEKVIQTLQIWFREVDNPNPIAYYLLAMSYYQLDRLDEALPPAKQAVALSSEPREGWFQLLLALYLNEDDYANARPVLEQLVTHFPKRSYWVQLSLIYSAVEDYQESLAVQQLAYTQGLLTSDKDLLRLARSYLYHDLPYPAARVLERGLEEKQIEPDTDAFELLGNSWIAAREYDEALEPLQTAASLSEDGQLYTRVAQVQLQREEWKGAAQALRNAIQKGGLDDPGQVHLLLGIAYYSDERVSQARPWFVRARQHESSRTEAEAWLEHIARESQPESQPG